MYDFLYIQGIEAFNTLYLDKSLLFYFSNGNNNKNLHHLNFMIAY